jgi:hypothetical protein
MASSSTRSSTTPQSTLCSRSSTSLSLPLRPREPCVRMSREPACMSCESLHACHVSLVLACQGSLNIAVTKKKLSDAHRHPHRNACDVMRMCCGAGACAVGTGACAPGALGPVPHGVTRRTLCACAHGVTRCTYGRAQVPAQTRGPSCLNERHDLSHERRCEWCRTRFELVTV